MVIVDNASVKLTATYTEPVVESDGSPLLDLAFTTISTQVAGGPIVGGPQTPATAPGGGGKLAVPVTVAVANGTKAIVTGFVTATSLSGKVSVPSAIGTFTVDRTLAPGAPTNFTLA